MAGEPAAAPDAMPVEGMRLGILKGFVLDNLAPEVAAAFAAACETLSRAGARLVDLDLAELDEYRSLIDAGLVNAEAFARHEELLARRGNEYDPRVRSRIERGRSVTAAQYIRACTWRVDLAARFAARTAGYDALLLPTVAIVAPRIADCARDEDFFRFNALALRNTGLINMLGRCAASLPIQPPGTPPVGLMVVGEQGGDRRLLAVARGIEGALD